MNICLFSSYSINDEIDNYVKFYIEMLLEHFDEVLFITNDDRNINDSELSFFNEIDVSVKLVKNEGYDFGMWYKALNSIDVNEYDEIAFVNDSCLLFMSLDKIMEFHRQSNLDFFGITSSNEILYHLQSYFTIAKGSKIINAIKNYYDSHGIIKSDDVRDIIQIYEIGLSKLLTDNNFKIGAMFKHNNYPKSTNISLMNATDIIRKGCPMIKKKLLFNSFRDHERSHLSQNKFDFKLDYINQIKNIIYPSNVNINYLLELK